MRISARLVKPIDRKINRYFGYLPLQIFFRAALAVARNAEKLLDRKFLNLKKRKIRLLNFIDKRIPELQNEKFYFIILKCLPEAMEDAVHRSEDPASIIRCPSA